MPRRWTSFWRRVATRLRRAASYPWYVHRARQRGMLEATRVGPAFHMLEATDYSPTTVRWLEAFIDHPDPLIEAPLDEASLVLDVGASRGEWAEAISARYGCRIHCFEPNPTEFGELARRVGGNARITCHEFGLSSTDRRVPLSVDGLGSSVVDGAPGYDSSPKVDVELRDAAGVFSELGILGVDLLKINIEGGEYELLEHLLAAGFHARCRCIRVQFHRWFAGAVGRRKRIRRVLEATHRLEWDYAFIWESWVLRDDLGPAPGTAPRA